MEKILYQKKKNKKPTKTESQYKYKKEKFKAEGPINIGKLKIRKI